MFCFIPRIINYSFDKFNERGGNVVSTHNRRTEKEF